MVSTMKDVARKAGVSLGTVSNVLNNSATVRPKNREKVLWAVEELGFRSNMVARALKTKVSKDIGLIIPSINNPFYPELARGVEDVANRAGLTVFLCNDDRDIQKERHYIESLIAKNISGLILVKPQISLAEIDDVCKLMPVILVDVGAPLGSSYNVISVDDRSGITQGLQLLYDHGHTKIAFIRGLQDSLSSQDRFDAYIQFLKSNLLPLHQEYVYQGNYDWTGGYDAARFLLSLPDPPTAIFSSNDLMALGCIKAAQEIGLKIPEDLSILGYDNLDITGYCNPRLTTINQPKYEMGTSSVKMLLRCMNQSDRKHCEKLILPTTLIQRDSVGTVRT